MRKFIFNIFVLFLSLMTSNKSFCYVQLPLDLLSFDEGQEEVLFEWLDSKLIVGDFAVRFERGRLDSRQVFNLIDFLSGSYERVRVTSIDFSNIEFFNESDLIRIVYNLPSTHVFMLNLSEHFFSRKLIAQLIESIPESKIKILKCLNCGINDEKAKRIARVFSREHKLFLINLANNSIGDIGAKALISNNCPNVVNLNNNNISDRGIVDIINSIIDGNFSIKSLSVAKNKFGNIGVREIFKKLKKFPETFGQINLSGIYVTDELLNNFSALEEAMSADEIDMYINCRFIYVRKKFYQVVYNSNIDVVINLWDRYLSPDVYDFVRSAINSELCLKEEYPWLGKLEV